MRFELRTRAPRGAAAAGLASAAVLLLATAGPATAVQIDIELANVGVLGHEGNNDTAGAAVSGDGRYVVFASNATNLVSPAPPFSGQKHLYLRDRVAGSTTLITRRADGGFAQAGSHSAAISHDGSVVAFVSSATDLVPAGEADTNGVEDVFVWREGIGITRVNGSQQVQPNGRAQQPAVSGDGRHIAFATDATNLVTGDTNGKRDIAVYDTQAATTRLVSRGAGGVPANGDSGSPSLDHYGLNVAFASTATNLVTGDTNGVSDVFQGFLTPTGITMTLASVSHTGAQANGASVDPVISGSGRYIAFTTAASNLASNDTNGQVDVYRRDQLLRSTMLVSVAGSFRLSNGPSFDPAISHDGKHVTFTSNATNLPGDGTGTLGDVYLATPVSVWKSGPRLVAKGVGGAPANHQTYGATVSSGGEVVAFLAQANNLVPGQDGDGPRVDPVVARLS